MSFITRLLLLFTLLLSTHVHAKVVLRGTTLVYQGQITDVNNEALYTLFDQADRKPNTLEISSGGGNVDLGMDLGAFVIKHQLHVRIPKFCFSSCANYVFTAGKTSWLGEKAILGWHGDAASAYWRDSDIDAMVEDLAEPAKTQEWQRLRQHYDAVIAASEQRENAFFNELGIDKALLTIGLNKEFVAAAKKQKARGWTMTPDLMQKMGLKNLHPDSAAWTPRSLSHFPLLIMN